MIRERTFKFVLSLMALLSAMGVGQAFAGNTILWQEGFETYNTDAGQIWGSLDSNQSGGPNQAPMNGWNPWFGNAPANGWVTKATTNPDPIIELVTPHSGNFMMRGSRNSTGWYNGFDRDTDYVNIAYRFHGGQPFKTSFSIDWWFYDIIGNDGTPPDGGPGNFGDWAAIEYRSAAPSDADYTNGGNIGDRTAKTAALGLGACEDGSGYITSVYQAQVKGATDAHFGDGWFNTTLTRSKGWHHASIVVNRCGLATFSIDNTVVLTHDTGAGMTSGFNVFATYECNPTPDTYNQSAYYDDITLAADLNPPVFADADVDGDVDQDDFGIFQACWTGAATGYDPAQCGCFDHNNDQKIDPTDLIAFNACYSGPMIPVTDPNCGN